MTIKAVQKYTRQTPRKVRLVANAVRKLSLEQALRQLSVIEKKATMVVSKVVKQAIADGINNHGYKFEDLVLENILVGEGPRYRRFRAVSRGRAHDVKKRTAHVTVILTTKDEVKAAPAKAEAAKAETKVEATPAKAEKAPAKKPAKKKETAAK
jgi:large subunit ribosomal protein L22